jgi:hypothetical protein
MSGVLQLVVASLFDDDRHSMTAALRFIETQIRLLEPGEILRRDEDEKPEQKHGRDVRAHAGAISDGGTIPFELREVEHAQDVVGPDVVDMFSVGSRSRSKRYDVSPVVRLIDLHLAPRPIKQRLSIFDDKAGVATDVPEIIDR